MMAAVKSRDTVPEKFVRSMLFREGFRFRLHRRNFPGKPDIVLSRYRHRAKSDAARDLLSQKYITGMRLFMLGFENSWQNVAAARHGGNGDARFDDMIDDCRGIAARASASVVLWLTDQLPKVIDLPDDTVE